MKRSPSHGMYSPETCAKFLHGFVINEPELNAVFPITNLDL